MPFKSYCLRGLDIFFPVRSTLKTTKSSFPALPWNSEIMSIKCLKRPGKLGQINRVVTATSSLEEAVSKSDRCNTSHGLQMGSPRQDFRIKYEKASRHFNKTRRTFVFRIYIHPRPPKSTGLKILCDLSVIPTSLLSKSLRTQRAVRRILFFLVLKQ